MVVIHGLTDFLERLGYLGNEAKVTTWSYKGSSLSLVSWSRLEMVMWTCGTRNPKKQRLNSQQRCVPGSKLPVFPYNRGWSSTQGRGGLYIPIIRIPSLKVGGLPSPM